MELVLESLPARTDRPARIPVPSPPGVLFIRRMTPTAMAAANSTPTLWLNADDTSNHPQLLSRAHAELGWRPRYTVKEGLERAVAYFPVYVLGQHFPLSCLFQPHSPAAPARPPDGWLLLL